MMITIIADNRPDAYEYAVLCQQTYKADLDDGAIIEVLPEWTVKIVREGSYGFQAVVFENVSTKQWVVGFKGTDSLSLLLAELVSVVLKGEGPYKDEAFKLVRDVVEGVEDLVLPSGYQLSFTGHSLGGFLAILSLYYAHTLKADWSSLNAVVFESPGAIESLKKIKGQIGKIDRGLLDIITYVSYPNIVNTFDSHNGDSLYTVPIDLEANKDWSGWYTKKAHSIEGFVDFFRPGREASDPDDKLLCLADWPINGASVIGGEKGYYFSHAKFDKRRGRYVLPDEEILIEGNTDKVLYQKSKALLFDGHYYEMADFSPERCLRLRHFNPGLRQFLSTFHAMKELLLADEILKNQSKQQAQVLNIPEDIVAKLLGYMLKRDMDGQWYVELTDSYGNPQEFRHTLSYWLAGDGQALISQWLQQTTLESDNRIKVIAELVAEGAVVDGIVVTNTAEGLCIYMREGAADTELEQAQQLMNRLKKVVKDVRAYLVAAGDKVSEKAMLWGSKIIAAAAAHVGEEKQMVHESAPNITQLLIERVRQEGVGGTSTNISGSSSSVLYSSARNSFDGASSTRSGIAKVSEKSVVSSIVEEPTITETLIKRLESVAVPDESTWGLKDIKQTKEEMQEIIKRSEQPTRCRRLRRQKT